MKQKPFFKKTLPNGLRVVIAPMEATKAVTLLVLVGTGSKYEIRHVSGVSHFLEHLFFKGTTKRPRPEQIARELDRLGAAFNAFTLKETTGYWVKSSYKDFDVSLDIIADILLDPLFKADEIEKERGVIIQEIMMYEDAPQRKVFDVWEELLYGGGQPAGRPIAGTVETVKGITRGDIIHYREGQYVGKNTVLVVAGNIGIQDGMKKIERAFHSFKKGTPRGKEKVEENQTHPQSAIFPKKTEQTHLIIGARAFDMYDERRYALNLLSVILGGTMSSRLFLEIREKLGLAYYIQSAAEYYTDSGYMFARAGVAHDSLEKTVMTIAEEFKKIADKGPSGEEVRFAKDHLRGSMSLSFESSDDIAQFYAERELFYKEIHTPEALFRRFEKVTRNDIMKVARDVFNMRRLNLAVVGPHKKTMLDSLVKKASRQT